MDFYYKAATFEGMIRQGKINAGDQKQAVSKIHALGLIPLYVFESENSLNSSTPASGRRSGLAALFRRSFFDLTFLPSRLGRRKVKNKDLIMFSENLSIMLKAGISLNKCLTIQADLTENKIFAGVIQNIHNHIREGSSLHQAMEKYPDVFPDVFASLVRAGESGGVLDLVLKRTSDYLREIQELKDYLVSSMIYPVILGITAIVSIMIMLTIVIPRFAGIFEDMGVELPAATKILLVSGSFLQAYWWMLILASGIVFFTFRYLVSTPGVREQWDRLKLRIPRVGSILLKVETARFSRTLGTLLSSGVSILAAMNIVKGVISNSALRFSLGQVYDDLKQGSMLSSSLEKRRVFPALAVNMLGVGEESGKTPEMLEKVGDMYDKEIKSSIKSFTNIFEPLVILVMGLIIGAMVVSMLLSIFTLNELGI